MVYGGIFVDLLELIIKFIASIIAGVCQAIVGLIFVFIESAIGFQSGENIVWEILEPLKEFSINILVPFGIEIMFMIALWNLIRIMFGKFSENDEDPFILIGKLIFLTVLILALGRTDVFTRVADGTTEILAIALKEKQDVINDASTALGESGNTFIDNVVSIIDPNGTSGVEIDQSSITKTPDDSSLTGGGSSSTPETVTREEYIETSKLEGVGALGVTVLVGVSSNAFLVLIIAMIAYIVVYLGMLIVISWKLCKLTIKLVSRMVYFFFTLCMAPLALACGVSKSTNKITSEWFKLLMTYLILIIFTGSFFSVAQKIVLQGFIKSASLSIFELIIGFSVISLLLDILLNLEAYLEKLGLNAMGANGRSAAGFIIGQTVTRLLGNMISGKGNGKLTSDNVNNAGKMNNLLSRVKAGFSKNKKNMINNVNQSANGSGSLLASKLAHGNARNMFANKNGTFGVDNDGKFHELAFDSKGNPLAATTDENGNPTALLSTDGTACKLDRYSDMGAETNRIKLGDENSSSSKVAGVSSLNSSKTLLETDGGNYYRNGITAIPKDQLQVTADGDVATWNVDGDVWGRLNTGEAVNLGSGETYEMADGNRMYAEDRNGTYRDVSRYVTSGSKGCYFRSDLSTEDAKYVSDYFGANAGDRVDLANNNVKYMTGSSRDGFYLNSANGQVQKGYRYDNDLPSNITYVDPSAFTISEVGLKEYSDGSYKGYLSEILADGKRSMRECEIHTLTNANKDDLFRTIEKYPNDRCTGITADGTRVIISKEALKGKMID